MYFRHVTSNKGRGRQLPTQVLRGYVPYVFEDHCIPQDQGPRMGETQAIEITQQTKSPARHTDRQIEGQADRQQHTDLVLYAATKCISTNFHSRPSHK